jgi:hypothetical protein
MASGATENDLRASSQGATIEVVAPPLDVQDTLDFGPHITALNLFYGFEVARAHFEGDQPPANDVMLLLISLAGIRDELVRVRARLQQLQSQPELGYKSNEKPKLQQRAQALQARASALQLSLERDVPRVPGLNAPVTPSIPLSIFLSPSTLTLLTGSTASMRVGVAGQLDLGARAKLELSSPHPGITGTFSPETAVSHSALTLDVAADVPPGSYNVGVRGTAGSLTATTTLKVTVKRFALSVSEPHAVLFPGGPAQDIRVDITRAPGFTGNVDLALDLVPSGAGFGGSFTPDPAPGGTSTLQIRAGRFAGPGTFALAIRGTSGAIVETVPFAVDVLDTGEPETQARCARS